MIEADRAVVRLTEEHSELIDGQTAVCDPLITMLWQARYPDMGRTVGGAGTGTPFDTHAIELYESLDGEIRAHLNKFHEHSTGDLIPLTKRLLEVIRTEDAGDRLDDRDRMYGIFTKWVGIIERKFDPPAVKDIMIECPECEQTHVADENGDLKRAVRVELKPGRALVAECHACGCLWAGEIALRMLAEITGQDTQEDVMQA